MLGEHHGALYPPSGISCLHLPHEQCQPPPLRHHIHLCPTLPLLHGAFLPVLSSKAVSGIPTLVLANAGLLAMGLSKQLPAHAFCKRSFLGQPSVPETAVLNTRPGAEPMLCSELFFFYSRQQSQPIHLLGFWIQSSFLLKNHPLPAHAALCRSGASRTALLPSPGASNSRRV